MLKPVSNDLRARPPAIMVCESARSGIACAPKRLAAFPGTGRVHSLAQRFPRISNATGPHSGGRHVDIYGGGNAGSFGVR